MELAVGLQQIVICQIQLSTTPFLTRATDKRVSVSVSVAISDTEDTTVT